MNKRSTDALIMGLALFAMFFGAGNLIFPPSLGLASGSEWIYSSIGFFLTGIGLPLMGIIAVAKAGGTITDVGNKVSPLFSKVFSSIIILAIGPLLAIPRTGATTYELGIKPLLPGASPIGISIIFFVLTLYFVIKPSRVIDVVGKFLTPFLFAAVLLIITKGIISPIGNPSKSLINSPIATGFLEGYQTMDALASLIFGAVMLNAIKDKGYKAKEYVAVITKAGIISAVGLLIVYGGFIYLGATAGTVFPSNTPKTALLLGISSKLFGYVGQITLGISVALACLTTAIGLTATVGNYFSDLTNKKISYEIVVIATVLFSALMANLGVEKIVAVAVPLLVTLYPVAIVLIVLTLLGSYIPQAFFSGAVIGTLVISSYDGLSAINISFDIVTALIRKLPLAGKGFGWLIPSLIGGILALIISQLRKGAFLRILIKHRS